MQSTIDSRDAEMVRVRMAKLDERTDPRVGDFVRFADGEMRRVSYIWQDDTGWNGGAQTTDGTGRFYLGEHGCSYSGALHPPVPIESLTLTDERLPGPVWVFHHDFAGAGRGVTFTPDFRVYACDRSA